MASTTSFDELNILSVEDSQESAIQSQIRRYFEVMDLPENEIEERIALASDLEKVFRNLFIMMMAMTTLNKPLEDEREYLYDYTYRGYSNALVDNGLYDNEYFENGTGYIAELARRSSQEIVDTTILYEADAYYTSVGRSIMCGETESNAVSNYERELAYIKMGYTKKTWVTKHDKRVRKTHIIVDNETIGIFDAFEVGDYLMMFPLDQSLGAGAEEIVRCRCVCHYSGQNKNLQNVNNDDIISKNERDRIGNPVEPTEKSFDMALNPTLFAYEIASKYNIHLRGSGKDIQLKYDDTLVSNGKVSELDPTTIRLGKASYVSEEELANTIAHELNHSRSFLKGQDAPEYTAYYAGDSLAEYIRGLR